MTSLRFGYRGDGSEHVLRPLHHVGAVVCVEETDVAVAAGHHARLRVVLPAHQHIHGQDETPRLQQTRQQRARCRQPLGHQRRLAILVHDHRRRALRLRFRRSEQQRGHLIAFALAASSSRSAV